ncbi:MAG TPA: dihydropteroate synthase [Gammaproteobacteria bacterium]
MFLQHKNGRLDLSQPRVMGILNVTPDSFADGGRYININDALRRAEEMVAEGADIVDIGGESTRPGAEAVSANEELDRVIPVIERLVASAGVPISVDTSKPAVMVEAVRAGASIINDVKALQEEGALQAAAGSGAGICLMHMQGAPRIMQQAPLYTDVVGEIKSFLQARIDCCVQGGIDKTRLLIDPGFGFGKTLQHNVQLLRNLQIFTELNLPLMVGLSRKSMLGFILGGEKPRPVEQRLYGSLAAVAWSVVQGAKVLRVHDVAATVDVLRVMAAVTSTGGRN